MVIISGKRAQLKIQQMTFMLLAVTLFFILVGLFFVTYSLGNLKKDFTDIQTENAQKIVSILANSPEFSCVSGQSNCVDMDKALVMKNREEYRNFWEIDSIEIRVLYPEKSKEVECTKGNYPECNVLKVFQKISGKQDLVSQQSNFVNICRKEVLNGENYERCDLGLIIVGFESIK